GSLSSPISGIDGTLASLILFSTNVTCDHSLATFFTNDTTIMSVFTLKQLFSVICSYARVVDDLAQALEQFLSVVVKVAIDRVDLLILNHVEAALRVSDQSFVVRDNDDATLVVVDGVSQRVNGLDVEVVGRFIQDYHIRRV
ncbi:hypothetical protein X777_12944, partial [Ooceraea biroi]